MADAWPFIDGSAIAAAAAAPLTASPSAEVRAALASATDEVESAPWDGPIVDANAPIQWYPLLPEFDPTEIDFVAVAESGLTLFSQTFGPTGNALDAEQSYCESLRGLAHASALVARYPDRLILVRRQADVDAAIRQRKLAMLVNFQDSAPLGSDVKRLDVLYSMGLRQLQVTYSLRNLAGDGCFERTQGGLSHFGVELVQKLNELGIVVDAAHCGPQTTLDTIETSNKPVILSHACCKAVYDHPRNKTDEAIKAMANKGGVLGISLVSWFVAPKERLSFGALLDHFDHAIRVAGPDHVGFGVDVGLPGWLVAGDPDRTWEMVRKGYSERDWKIARAYYPPFIREVNDAKRYVTIARGLLKRGYSMSDVKKVMGQNLLRVYRQVLGA